MSKHLPCGPIPNPGAGELDCLEAIFAFCYAQKAYRYVRFMLPHEYEDLFQEILIKLLENFQDGKLNTPISRKKLNQWLNRLTHWRVLDHLRKQYRCYSALRSEYDVNQLVAQRTTDPHEDYAISEEIKRLKILVNDLPLRQRQAVTYVDLLGYSYSDTAEIMSLSIGTIKSNLNAARRKLKMQLRAASEDNTPDNRKANA